MHRLYLRIYIAFVGIVLLSMFVALGIARYITFSRPVPQELQALVRLIGDRLPGSDASGDALQTSLTGLSAELSLDLSIWDSDRALLATAGQALRASGFDNNEPSWIRYHRRVGVMVQLEDGRWLAAASGAGPLFRHEHWLLVVLIGVMAIGCHPLARQITRRLEHLQKGVTDWGSGDLSARLEVKGHDEVAMLGLSFNKAATRIESLVNQQKEVLANASHELRSPLTRLRMALELLGGDAEPNERQKLIADAGHDIEELDELIGDVLLTSRLEAIHQLETLEIVDLLDVLQTEGERVGARITGEPIQVAGNKSMLSRLFRNLFENAKRHSDAIEAWLEIDAEQVRVCVADRGPGVAETDRERIFERFYRQPGQEQTGGTGLGLALVRQIAEIHGGEVGCHPRKGGGSRFEVRLPLGV